MFTCFECVIKDIIIIITILLGFFKDLIDMF